MTSEEEKRASRRSFLRGKVFSPPAEQAAQSEEDSPPGSDAASPAGAYLLQLSRKAMACQFEVYLNAARPGWETEAAVTALDMVTALEEQLSAYRYDSEICRLNATAYLRPQEVEPRLYELLELSLQLYHDTQGAFDITAGPLSKVWGFFDRAGKVPRDEDLEQARRLVGSYQVQLDPQRRTLLLQQEGVELNLGSIGKGYALDRCREVMAEAGVADFLVHGGTSSVLAQGRRQDSTQREGWEVGVPHPLRPDRRIGTVHLQNEALGTSGAEFQAFVHEGKRYGHVLDPRTGRPATEVLSATVIAPTGALADALATASYVMGREQTEEFLTKYPDVAVLMVLPAKRRGGVETVMLGGMEDRLVLAPPIATS